MREAVHILERIPTMWNIRVATVKALRLDKEMQTEWRGKCLMLAIYLLKLFYLRQVKFFSYGTLDRVCWEKKYNNNILSVWVGREELW